MYSASVDAAEILRNRIMLLFQAIQNMPGYWDGLPKGMRRQAGACMEAGGRYMKNVFSGNVKGCHRQILETRKVNTFRPVLK
jgi:hypothetical protein